MLAQGSIPSQQFAFSSSPSVNALFGDAMRAASVRLSETDANHDGRPEILHLEVSIPLRTGEDITGITILTALGYELQDTARFSSNATAIVQYTGGVAGSGVQIWGDLDLQTSRALPPFSTGSTGPPKLVNVDEATSTADLTPSALISRHALARSTHARLSALLSPRKCMSAPHALH